MSYTRFIMLRQGSWVISHQRGTELASGKQLAVDFSVHVQAFEVRQLATHAGQGPPGPIMHPIHLSSETEEDKEHHLVTDAGPRQPGRSNQSGRT